MSGPYSLLREAIINRQQVIVHYQGYVREVCPHVLGYKNGRQHVLTYQFAGGSKSGLPPEGQWRCMDVSGLTVVRVHEGAWYTGDSHLRPQTCVDQIDVQVLSDTPAPKPYAKRA